MTLSGSTLKIEAEPADTWICDEFLPYINVISRDVCTYNIAVRYGMVQENREPIKFYFEEVGEKCGN